METLRREENNLEEFFFRTIKIGSFQFNNLWNLWTNSMETLRRQEIIQKYSKIPFIYNEKFTHREDIQTTNKKII